MVDTYVVVYASLLIAGGTLSDRLGRKGLFLAGVILFAAGSLAAGLTPNIGVLLAGRIVQGLGPALLVPGSLTIIRAVFANPRTRAMAIGLWSTSSGVALAVGPPLGGLLVAGLGWRSVFWLNAPLAAALAVIGARHLPRLPRVRAAGRFDWPAAVLDLSLFTNYAFAAANVAAFVVFFAFVGVLIYFSAYFQQVQGHGPVAAGVDLLAIGVAYAAATTVAGRLVGRVGERWPMLAGLVIAGLATLALLRLQPDTGIDAIWPNFAALGAGIGLCGTPMSTVAMSAVDADRAGMASAVVNALRQIGQVFGVAVLGALIYADLPGASGTGAPLTPAQQATFVTGLHHALWVCGLALLAAAAPVVALSTHPEITSEETTMADDPAAIAAAYFAAWKSNDIEKVRPLLHPDVDFAGALGATRGIEDTLAGLGGMFAMTKQVDVIHRWADGPDVLTWFELRTATAGPLAIVNWSRVEAGRITRIRVTFDPRPMLA